MTDPLPSVSSLSGYTITDHILSETELDRHVEQRIQERANLGHLYTIEDGPDGPEAMLTDEAAASLWRAVQDAISEAGWSIS